MSAMPSQIADFQRHQFDVMKSIGQAMLGGAEKLAMLNLAATKAVFQDSTETNHAMLSATDSHKRIALATAIGQQNVEKVVGYSRNAYGIASATTTEISKILETQFAAANRKMGELIDLATKTMPAGSEPVVAMFKNAVAMSTTAFATASKTAKQAADTAESNFAAAASAAENGTNPSDDVKPKA